MQKISVNSEKKLITIIPRVCVYPRTDGIRRNEGGGGNRTDAATSFEFWKTAGSKTKCGNIIAVKISKYSCYKRTVRTGRICKSRFFIISRA